MQFHINEAGAGSERWRLLDRSRWREADPSAGTRILAPNRPARKPPTLPPAANIMWQEMISPHRILGHDLTDIARGLWRCAKFLRQRAMGDRLPSSGPPRGGVDPLEERVLFTLGEPEVEEIRLLTRTRYHGRTRRNQPLGSLFPMISKGATL